MPLAFRSSYVFWQLSDSQTPPLIASLSSKARTCGIRSAENIGSTGSDRTTSKSGWLGGLTVSQRNPLSMVTSVWTLNPSLLTYTSYACFWSRTSNPMWESFVIMFSASFGGLYQNQLITLRVADHRIGSPGLGVWFLSECYAFRFEIGDECIHV